MTIVDAVVIAARLLQFSAAAILGGGALFFLYGVAPRPDAGWATRLIRGAAAVGALATLGWLMAQSAQIGSGPADAFSAPAVWSVAADTGFGRIALLRFGLFLIAAAITLGLRTGRQPWWFLGLLGMAATASFAWTGHGARDEGLTGVVHIVADVLHLAAASVWIGALVVLAFLACLAGRKAAAPGDGGDALLGLVRFSAVGVSVVGVLVASGLVNTWFLVGPTGASRVLTSPYGQLLLAKLGLFGVMLALAAANRYRHTPALDRAFAAKAGVRALAPVIRAVVAETALAILVLALVSWLGTLSPPFDG